MNQLRCIMLHRSRLLCTFWLVSHFKISFFVIAFTHDNILSIMLFIYHDMHAVVQSFIRIKDTPLVIKLYRILLQEQVNQKTYVVELNHPEIT